VVSQSLLPRCDTEGRIAAFEVMVVTPSIRTMVRDGKTHQLVSDIQTGGEHGMQTLDNHLLKLVEEKKVDYEVALSKSTNVLEFERRALARGIAPGASSNA
jgi:twitching motility protein PilT